MSTRRITDKQRADGTVISGEDLEHALQDLEDHVNKVPVRDLERTFVQTQFVAGYLPRIGDRTPYLFGVNDTNEVSGSVTPTEFENQHRTKGTAIEADPNTNVWSISAKMEKPVIVTQLDAILVTDTTFGNIFQYDTEQPPGKTASAIVDDITVLLTVDNPWARDDAEMNSLVLIRKEFTATAERINFGTPVPAAPADMLPPHSVRAHLTGLWVSLRDIVVPIPAGSRVRWSLVIPHYTGDLQPWGATPWARQISNFVLTMLEELEA